MPPFLRLFVKTAITLLLPSAIALATVFLGTGCSSDNTTLYTVTKHITAAEGGTVSDESGTVVLAIPAGALEKDTDITLTVSEPEAGSASNVYDFGPDGTMFSKPATLSAKLSGTVPEGKIAQLSTYEAGGWKALDNFAFANGIATGNVAHFTKFTIVFVNGRIVKECVNDFHNWAGCGGNPQGTWKFSRACADMTIGGNQPVVAGCPTAIYEVDYQVDFSMTIDATTVTKSNLTGTQTVTLTIPTSCYATTTMHNCGEVKTATKMDTCTEASGNCTCTTSAPVNSAVPPPEPYTVNGTKITMGTNDPVEFCVTGSQFSYEQIDKTTMVRTSVMFLDKQ